ncbi:hypothetical protein F2Q69_00049289 [Brassica cretica]|uniref:Uncharacterized protein n=1 Tax=Brassica cretica TaxID=69181 RepID=A0A8S9Q2X8_BRACR|nr:hypothetical protein F2Q69_00049289 [Brassica cretica]
MSDKRSKKQAGAGRASRKRYKAAFLLACPRSRLPLGPFGEKAEYMGLGRTPSDCALLVVLLDG